MTLRANVGAYMSSHPVTIGAEDDLETAHSIFADYRLSLLPVVDGHGRCVGVLSKTDLASREAPEAKLVHELMTQGRYAVHGNDGIGEAAALVVAAGIHHAVVVDGHDRTVGVLSTVDVVRALADSRQEALVSEVMTQEPVTFDPAEDISTALSELEDGGYTTALVLNGGHIAGYVTRLELSLADPDDRVDSVMHARVELVSPDATVTEAARRMVEAEVRLLAVMDSDNELVGLVTTTDLTGYVAALTTERAL